MCESIKNEEFQYFEHSIEIRRRIYQKLLECKCGKCDICIYYVYVQYTRYLQKFHTNRTNEVEYK